MVDAFAEVRVAGAWAAGARAVGVKQGTVGRGWGIAAEEAKPLVTREAWLTTGPKERSGPWQASGG